MRRVANLRISHNPGISSVSGTSNVNTWRASNGLDLLPESIWNDETPDARKAKVQLEIILSVSNAFIPFDVRNLITNVIPGLNKGAGDILKLALVYDTGTKYNPASLALNDPNSWPDILRGLDLPPDPFIDIIDEVTFGPNQSLEELFPELIIGPSDMPPPEIKQKPVDEYTELSERKRKQVKEIKDLERQLSQKRKLQDIKEEVESNEEKIASLRDQIEEEPDEIEPDASRPVDIE